MRRQGKNGVCIALSDVCVFNASWPASPIELRSHFVEFATNGDLVDHDFTESEDGAACLALIADAEAWLLQKFDG